MEHMRTIGLIGGMSWESSAVYYQLINREVKARLGGLHSCRSLMYSVDFAEIEQLQDQEDWDQMNALMADAARRLERGGAEIIVLCTNTMHLCSGAIREAVSIPFLHIAEATGRAIRRAKLSKVALLGTRHTMEKDFYKQLLTAQFEIEVLIPDAEERQQIDRIIYRELVLGEIKEESRQVYQRAIARLAAEGAEGVVLGCTEIPLLIRPEDVDIPIFDTTAIHALEAVRWATRGEELSRESAAVAGDSLQVLQDFESLEDELD